MLRAPLCCLWMLATAVAFLGGAAVAEDRYYPLDHRQPVGVAGRWSLLTQPNRLGQPQLIEVHPPSTGQVSFYSGSPHNPVAYAGPVRAGLVVGHVYRLRLSQLPEFPGLEVFPTVELVDRLHPPAELVHEFPIPIEFTEEEIAMALSDRMVTKVIYLEHPDRAAPIQQTAGPRTEDLPVTANLLQAADQRGRPMAIIRIGGRIPDPRSPTDEFYSQSPLLLFSQ